MSRQAIIIVGIALIAIAVLLGKDCSQQRNTGPEWDLQRQKLVEHLRENGISDERVLAAIGMVPRHAFVPVQWRLMSYIDQPLYIDYGQTISQPFIVALMCQELGLKPTDRVLEIGTGSGYHAAVMSVLCEHVYSIEIIPELAISAKLRLDSLGYRNIDVQIGDGYDGLPGNAPYDAIILTAAPEEIPRPLKRQMKLGGRLIAPVGSHWQELVLVERTSRGYTEKSLLPVSFVPMTGRALDGN